MTQYLLINFIFTATALSINHWLNVPHRIRLYSLVFALISWLIPYGLINIEISHEYVAYLPINVIELSQPISSVNQSVENTFDFTSIFALLIIMGLILFLRDVHSSQKFIKKIKLTSKQFEDFHNVRISEKINGAFVSGYFKPIIWISQNIQDKQTVETIITHEHQHIKNNDQFWLLVVTFIQRLMWCNPLVYFLSQKCRQSIELSCDEQCKQKLGRTFYQRHLAQIMLNNNFQNMLLNNPINHNKNFNITRIEQLNQDNHMTKSNYTKYLMTSFSAVLLASITLISIAKDSPMPEITENQVLLTLIIQNSDKPQKELSILTNQGEEANVTYDNHDFSFITQILPAEPTQVYIKLKISEIENDIKKEISNPGIVIINTKWGAFKFGQGSNYFDIKIKAQTNSKVEPLVEAVDNYIKHNDPAPELPTAPTIPKPIISANPTQPSQPKPVANPKPLTAPQPENPSPATPPIAAPEPAEVETNQ